MITKVSFTNKKWENFVNRRFLKLAYHNHDFEFTKFGSTGYEILLNETDKT
jgi:hypothetical protein